MSDLIDREALLRQIDIDSEGEPGYYGDTWKFIDTIKSMPPAELSTNLAEVGTDCISRQAAIDYFVTNVGFHDEDGYPIEDTDELRKIWTEYFSGIPSAEPKKGKWIDGYCSECGAHAPFWAMASTYHKSNFCPNCGSDMRGEQE